MAIQYIKRGKSIDEKASADAKVQEIVRGILTDIREQGDAAVRTLSQKFDNWSPDHFKLSAEQIQALMDSLPQQVIDDIKFAQTQVRNFAQAHAFDA